MREIKFRKWDMGEMDYSPEIWADGEGGILVNYYIGHNEDGIWMQYTGLKDKNGVEIYEGDVYRIRYYSAMWRENLETVQAVVWDEDKTSFGLRQKDMKSIEVIGNIYENPELLKGESE